MQKHIGKRVDCRIKNDKKNVASFFASAKKKSLESHVLLTRREALQLTRIRNNEISLKRFPVNVANKECGNTRKNKTIKIYREK